MAIPPVIDLPSLSDGPQGSVCASFEKQLDVAIEVLEMTADAIDAPVDAIRDLLDDIVGEAASAIGDIEDGLSDIFDAVLGTIPVVEGDDEWLAMMEACGLLEDTINAQSATNIASELLDNTLNASVNALTDQLQLLESLVELPIATAINAVNRLLEELKVPDFLSSIDELFNCMDSICTGADLTNKIQYVDDLLDEMYVDDNGFLLDDRLMNDSGISQAQRDIIIDAQADLLDTGDTALNSATASIAAGTAALKSLVSAPARAVDQVKSFFT
jgi:hypothetical protein